MRSLYECNGVLRNKRGPKWIDELMLVACTLTIEYIISFNFDYPTMVLGLVIKKKEDQIRSDPISPNKSSF